MNLVSFALCRPRTIGVAVLAVASGVLLFRHRVNSAWLVLGGAVAGLLAPA